MLSSRRARNPHKKSDRSVYSISVEEGNFDRENGPFLCNFRIDLHRRQAYTTLMKTWIVLFGILTVGTLEAKAWPLFCRSGPGLSVRIHTTTVGVSRLRVYITFPRINTAAGQKFENLQPGQCSWPDRPLRANEVTEIQTVIGGEPIYYVTPDHRLVPSILGPYCALRDPKGIRFKIFIENKGNNFEVAEPGIQFQPMGAGSEYNEFYSTECKID